MDAILTPVNVQTGAMFIVPEKNMGYIRYS